MNLIIPDAVHRSGKQHPMDQRIAHAQEQATQITAVLGIDWVGRSIFSIGSGLALTETILAGMYGIRRMTLMDGGGPRPGRCQGYMQNPAPEPWDDVERGAMIARATLPGAWISTIHPGEEPAGPFHLVISLYSWCHHYPAETYLDLVDRHLARNGWIVTDVRLGQNGKDKLVQAGYEIRKIIADPEHKCERVFLKRSLQCRQSGHASIN